MKAYQHQFIEFALKIGVLRFGKFTLKSGRVSPYFFNSGLFNTGSSLAKLGQFYGQAILDSQLEFDCLFGPAYKGIPLASATSIALSEHYHLDIPYSFNRKEVKDHGEGGQLVGSRLKDRVLIIDDVISAGTSVRESITLIKAEKARASGIIIALDRQEKGQDQRSAIDQIRDDYQLPVISIITLTDLLDYLKNNNELNHYLDAVQQYRIRYGA